MDPREMRAMTLSMAVQLLAGTLRVEDATESDVETVIEVAKKFEQHITGSGLV